jgi:hypothetical protein
MGLDNAGKSTALYRMKNSRYCETIPTVGFNCEKVKSQNGKSKGTSFTIVCNIFQLYFKGENIDFRHSYGLVGRGWPRQGASAMAYILQRRRGNCFCHRQFRQRVHGRG